MLYLPAYYWKKAFTDSGHFVSANSYLEKKQKSQKKRKIAVPTYVLLAQGIDERGKIVANVKFKC